MKIAPLHSLPIIQTPFERVTMNILGPLKRTKSGYKYLLVIMDYATKWPEAFPLRNVTTESVVECLIELTARLGVPKEFLNDNGTNFVSRTMKKFCDLAGILSYHPQTDGMVERFNATIKHLLWSQRRRTQWIGINVYHISCGLMVERPTSRWATPFSNCSMVAQ